MIDKNEMRIGNYFIGEDKILWLSQIRHAENVKEWAYKGWHEETKQRIEVNFFEAEPIPLTTEILERCNMKKRFDTVDCNIWDSIEEPPTRNKAFSLALLTQGWVYLAAPGAQAFKYVHQFQNLIYALTQKELEIKL